MRPSLSLRSGFMPAPRVDELANKGPLERRCQQEGLVIANPF